jgi:hypothetical protein
MRSHKQRKTGLLTLGELVVAVSEVAFEVSKDEKRLIKSPVSWLKKCWR